MGQRMMSASCDPHEVATESVARRRGRIMAWLGFRQ